MNTDITRTLQTLLDAYPHALIHLTSGEGEGPGTTEAYQGPRTIKAIRTALKHERCGGDRWARAMIDTSGKKVFGADLETGEQHPWLYDE